MDEPSALVSEYELKELRAKAQSWDIAYPALIFLDAMGALNGNLPNQILKEAVQYYNSSKSISDIDLSGTNEFI